MKRNIALLYGGMKDEHEVSVSGFGYVKKLIESSGNASLPIYVSRSGEWRVTDSDGEHTALASPEVGGSIRLDNGRLIHVDAAIPLLHGVGGESGEIQGALKTASIPFVGADTVTGGVCLDKHYTKCVAQSLGIPVTKWVCFSEKTNTATALGICREKIGYPMFIKPRRLGSSVGAHPVYGEDDFSVFFPKSMEAGSNLVIVEELIDNKRELECAFYSALGVTNFSAPGEILTDGFYGYSEKYEKQTKTTPKASVDIETLKRLDTYNRLLASTLSLRHLARIDYFLRDGKVIFNEVNTFPGFTEHSLYPKLLSEMGIDPSAAISAFVEDAIVARTL